MVVQETFLQTQDPCISKEQKGKYVLLLLDSCLSHTQIWWLREHILT